MFGEAVWRRGGGAAKGWRVCMCACVYRASKWKQNMCVCVHVPYVRCLVATAAGPFRRRIIIT